MELLWRGHIVLINAYVTPKPLFLKTELLTFERAFTTNIYLWMNIVDERPCPIDEYHSWPYGRKDERSVPLEDEGRKRTKVARKRSFHRHSQNYTEKTQREERREKRDEERGRFSTQDEAEKLPQE